MKAALPLITAILALAACVPASKAPPTAAPRPAARPVARPLPPAPSMPPVLRSDSWMDGPETRGSWTYEDRGNLTLAAFTTPTRGMAFAIHCNRPSRALELMMAGQTGARPAMTIRTETVSRAIGAALVLDEFARVTATLPASDPLLDAMALSKGRFAVEVEGLAPLILPSHAEVSRVIEDCR